jgi:hypothetical protein
MTEYDISCEFFINALYHVEDILFYSYVGECFYHERVFCQMPFIYQLRWSFDFPHFAMLIYHHISLTTITLSLLIDNLMRTILQTQLVMWFIILIYVEFSFYYCVKNFYVSSHNEYWSLILFSCDVFSFGIRVMLIS